jgi:hypothetical protein
MKEFFDIWENNPMLDGENQNPSCVLSIDINEPHYFMEGNGLFLMMPFKMHLCPV